MLLLGFLTISALKSSFAKILDRACPTRSFSRFAKVVRAPFSITYSHSISLKVKLVDRFLTSFIVSRYSRLACSKSRSYSLTRDDLLQSIGVFDRSDKRSVQRSVEVFAGLDHRVNLCTQRAESSDVGGVQVVESLYNTAFECINRALHVLNQIISELVEVLFDFKFS